MPLQCQSTNKKQEDTVFFWMQNMKLWWKNVGEKKGFKVLGQNGQFCTPPTIKIKKSVSGRNKVYGHHWFVLRNIYRNKDNGHVETRKSTLLGKNPPSKLATFTWIPMIPPHLRLTNNRLNDREGIKAPLADSPAKFFTILRLVGFDLKHPFLW